MIIPTNYEAIFKNRVLVITGMGRSGTTIVGKLLASMENVFYIFEPAILKYYINSAFISSYNDTGKFTTVLRGVMFEDYFLPLIAGRSINPQAYEWTYAENQWATSSKRTKKLKKLTRRHKILEYIADENPLFIVKTLEQQLTENDIRKFFPGCQLLHVIRNGLDVVTSSVNRKWHTPKYYNEEIVDWVLPPSMGKVNYPLYIDESSKDWWSRWTEATRAACVWRNLMETTQGVALKYEDLCSKPAHYTKWLASQHDLTQTDITQVHIDSIKEHKESKAKKVTLDDIELPERDKFAKTMKKFGYK